MGNQIMGNRINDKGQISGMAVVLGEPHAGEVHASVATPVKASVGTSVADVAPTLPETLFARECWQTAFAEIRTAPIRAIAASNNASIRTLDSGLRSRLFREF
jgi:hypothetical protein